MIEDQDYDESTARRQADYEYEERERRAIEMERIHRRINALEQFCRRVLNIDQEELDRLLGEP